MIARVARAAALAAIVGGCASTDLGEQPKHVRDLALDPYAMHEECARLAPGDRLDYSFTSSAPVNFNLHYHDGAAIVEPITRQAVREDAGVFVVVLAQDYCLMWEAGPVAAVLDYRVGIRRAID